LETQSTPTTIASSKDGILLVGTSDGACVYNDDGTLKLRFGSGITHAFSYRGQVFAADGTGNVYDVEGRLRSRLPTRKIIATTEWRDTLVILGKFEDDRPWVGLYEIETGLWQPLDLPLPPVPAAMISDSAHLYVLGGGLMLVADQAELLPQPSASQLSISDGQHSSQILKADEHGFATTGSTVQAMILPERVWPWRNPRYTVAIEGVSSDTLRPGQAIDIPRLSWGSTPAKVRSEWAGITVEQTIQIHRVRPWWLSWPGLFLGGVVFASTGYALTKLRTRSLERRAQKLQAQPRDSHSTERRSRFVRDPQSRR
jgi:hypothetical protein